MELKFDIFKRANEAGKLAAARHVDLYESGGTYERMDFAFVSWIRSNSPKIEALYLQFAEGYDERNKRWTRGRRVAP